MVNSSSAEITIEKLRSIFATLGLPQILVTDNGPQFTSGILHNLPRKRNQKCDIFAIPSLNQWIGGKNCFLEGMRWQKSGSTETHVAMFLFAYRNTPHSTTGASPTVMMFNRPLRCRLDLLKPNIENTIQGQQIQQQLNHDIHSKDRKFQINDTVFVENFGHGSKWLAGTIE